MFKLYREEQGTLPFSDYGYLLKVAAGKQSVLEFGPGISTLAFVEAGLTDIVTCEHAPEWLGKAQEALKAFPQCRVLGYENVAPAALVGALNGHPEFDLALVDSPSGVEGHKDKEGRVRLPGQEDCSRLNTCLAALRHSKIIYLHDWFRANERATLERLSSMGHRVTIKGNSCFARIDRDAG